MLRTDHCYPPTTHMPLGPPIIDHHFEALTMPAPLPPTIEPLTPNHDPDAYHLWRDGRMTPTQSRRGGLPPLPEVMFTDDEAEALWQMQQRARARIAVERKIWPQPPRRVPWLACVVGAALFAVGYYVGRLLP